MAEVSTRLKELVEGEITDKLVTVLAGVMKHIPALEGSHAEAKKKLAASNKEKGEKRLDEALYSLCGGAEDKDIDMGATLAAWENFEANDGDLAEVQCELDDAITSLWGCLTRALSEEGSPLLRAAPTMMTLVSRFAVGLGQTHAKPKPPF